MKTQKIIDISTRTLMFLGLLLITIGYLNIDSKVLINELFVKIGFSCIILSSITTILDYFFPKK